MTDNKFNFTIKAIEKLTCPADLREVRFRDARTSGLFITVSQGGNKSYVFRRKVGGITRQKVIGRFPEITIEQARTQASEWNSAVGKGTNPFEQEPAAEDPTLGALFRYYLDNHMKEKRKTFAETEKNFYRWFCSPQSTSLKNRSQPIADRKASSISHQDAEQLHMDIRNERGDYAANRAIQLGRAVFFFAIKKKRFVGDNPFAGITLFRETPRERFLSDEEAVNLLVGLRTEPNDDLRDFILLDLCTGVRKTNLLSMRWADVDFEKARWTIPDTKNSTRQVVPLSALEMTVLRQRHEKQKEAMTDSEFVFPGKGETGHLTDLKRSWTSFRKRMGLVSPDEDGELKPNVTIHDLRRSLAAAMANRNINVALIKSALHHKDLKTTLNAYAHAGKPAELEARGLAVTPWLEASGFINETGDVLPFNDQTFESDSIGLREEQ